MTRAVLRRLRAEQRGYTLVELVVVMSILSLVLGGLTTVFVSGSHAETDLNRRFQAQQQARLALDALRGDAHCASAAQTQTISTYPGLKLNVSQCSATTPTVSWCVLPSAAMASRYALWRSTATAGICTTTDTTRKLVADDLIASSGIFSTSLVNNGLQTVSVDFPVDANPTSTTADVYVLNDQLVERNSSRCASSGACTQPTVP
ncbi:MAG: PulJ/GspJ family protein [Gaiellaceae bacterium]